MRSFTVRSLRVRSFFKKLPIGQQDRNSSNVAGYVSTNLSSDLSSNLSSNLSLQNIYRSKVAEGALEFDENQFKLIKLLNKMSTYLVDQQQNLHNNDNHEANIVTDIKASSIPIKTSTDRAKSSSEISGTSEAIKTTENTEKNSLITPEDSLKFRSRGLYIYGNVGTGKTVVMDMFFDHCAIKAKKRVHFHQFMLNIHHRIHVYKKELLEQYGRDVQLNMSSERDAIVQVANGISDECVLLCFDEFQVLLFVARLVFVFLILYVLVTLSGLKPILRWVNLLYDPYVVIY
jgi:predicted ATPase